MALSSAGLAREFLRDHWCAEHNSADLARAQLIVTELVTNAVRHGGPPIELQMECLIGGGVMLSVSDGTPDVPVAQEEDHARWGGHGVALVDLLSAEWGVQQHLQQQHLQPQRPDHDRHSRRHVADDLTGDLAGDVAGDVISDVAGDVISDVAGDAASDVAAGGHQQPRTGLSRQHPAHQLAADEQPAVTSTKSRTRTPAKTVWCRLVA